MKTTEENNRLIAEFLGLQLEQDQERLYINGLGTKLINETFNKDWNWLMEVVEKIENLTNENNFILYDFTIFSDAVLIADQQGNEVILINKSDNGEFTTKIEATYLACVRFIEGYNKNGAKS
jgi:hypothetical protein